MRKLLNATIRSKWCLLIETMAICWSFDMYWISVSGAMVLLPKIILFVLPFIIFYGYTVKNKIKSDKKNRDKQRAIIIHSRIRRILDKVA